MARRGAYVMAMAPGSHSFLPARGLLAASGKDAGKLLQGLISNDIELVSPERAIYAALLTPQGKYLHDFFVLAHPDGDGFLLDCEAERLPDLARRLAMYRLRAEAEFADVSANLAVAALFGEGALDRLSLPAEEGRVRPLGGGIVYVDPRLAAVGARAVLPAATASAALEAAGLAAADAAAYDRWRLSHGLPDGSRDIAIDKSLLIECGFDELHGIDYDKGCYVGQEITARTHYRAKIRKRLIPVAVDGPLPPPGTPIADGADRPAGELRSGREDRALALLRLDRIGRAEPSDSLHAGRTRLTVARPDWMRF